MSDKAAEPWKKDGWNHDPRKLVDIMVKYSEAHDGSGSLDMEMIDDILTIAAERPKAWNEAIDAAIELTNEHDYIRQWPELRRKLEGLKHKQP